MEDAVDSSEEPPVNQSARRRVVDLHLAFVVEKGVVRGHAQQWDPEMKAHWNATQASPSEGSGAAISAWAADQCREKAARRQSKRRMGIYPAPPMVANLTHERNSRFPSQLLRVPRPRLLRTRAGRSPGK